MLRRLQLFFGIVWREWYGGRMSVREAWTIAGIMHPWRG